MDKILHYFVSHYCTLDWTTSMPGAGSVPPVNKFSIYFQKYPISRPFQEILCFFLVFWNAELILLLLEGAHSYCSQPWRSWTLLAGSAGLAPISCHGTPISDLWVFRKNQLSSTLDSHQWKQSNCHSGIEHLMQILPIPIIDTTHLFYS